MKHVYIVTAGEYSDYRIVGVFTNIKKAIAFCNSMKPDDSDDWYERYYVEKHKLNDTADTKPLNEIGVSCRFEGIKMHNFTIGMIYGHDIKLERDLYMPYIFVRGDIKMIEGESLSDFVKRARKIVIDKFCQWGCKEMERRRKENG